MTQRAHQEVKHGDGDTSCQGKRFRGESLTLTKIIIIKLFSEILSYVRRGESPELGTFGIFEFFQE